MATISSVSSSQPQTAQNGPPVPPLCFKKVKAYRDKQNSIKENLGDPQQRAVLGRSIDITQFLVIKALSPRENWWEADTALIQNTALIIQKIQQLPRSNEIMPSVKEISCHIQFNSPVRITIVSENGGKDLETFIDEHGRTAYPMDVVQAIGSQIISNLHHLHENHVAHRDLKPDNIVIQQNGNQFSVRFIDFDFATIVNENMPINGVGTLPYIAPELILNPIQRDQLLKADIFAVGAILLLLATGYELVPYPSPTSAEEELLNTGIDLEKEMIQQERLNGKIYDRFYLQLYGIQQTLGVFPTIYQEQLAALGWENGSVPCFLKETERTTRFKELLLPLEQRVKNLQLLELLKRMLALDPTQRPTAKEVLESPFFESALKLHSEALEEEENNLSSSGPPAVVEIAPETAAPSNNGTASSTE